MKLYGNTPNAYPSQEGVVDSNVGNFTISWDCTIVTFRISHSVISMHSTFFCKVWALRSLSPECSMCLSFMCTVQPTAVGQILLQMWLFTKT
jgi:hypothetical protein